MCVSLLVFRLILHLECFRKKVTFGIKMCKHDLHRHIYSFFEGMIPKCRNPSAREGNLKSTGLYVLGRMMLICYRYHCILHR